MAKSLTQTGEVRESFIKGMRYTVNLVHDRELTVIVDWMCENMYAWPRVDFHSTRAVGSAIAQWKSQVQMQQEKACFFKLKHQQVSLSSISSCFWVGICNPGAHGLQRKSHDGCEERLPLSWPGSQALEHLPGVSWVDCEEGQQVSQEWPVQSEHCWWGQTWALSPGSPLPGLKRQLWSPPAVLKACQHGGP